MRVTKAKFVLLLFISSTWGCQNKMKLDSNSVPTTLIIAAFVGEGPDETKDRYSGVARYLQEKLNINVELLMTNDYTAVVESLRSKKSHIGYLSTFAYVLSYDKGDFKPLVTVCQKDRPYAYKSIIITHKRTGLKSMDDVKARAKDLTFCFTDPVSTSGHLVPRSYLNKMGIDPETSFKQVVFSSSHAASVMSVSFGNVDVGCTHEIAMTKYKDSGAYGEGDIVVLWKSEAVVNSPIVIRNDINEDFAKIVQQAYLDMPANAPLVWKGYLEKQFANPDSLNYMVACDSMYNYIRELVVGIKDVNVIHYE